MFEEYHEIFQKVLQLSRNDNNNLEDYLLELEFEAVKVIQTIMYIGRDRDYPENSNPQDIYRYNREGLDGQKWNSKEVEVSQIVSKAPLYGYLRDGFKILQINIQ
ncbi:hypothetical protein [Clostridium sp.]|uniref:hypothetical protein n=1 Tax=Clostridium sp. TaxID=1506 RepID=UPI00321797D3